MNSHRRVCKIPPLVQSIRPTTSSRWRWEKLYGNDPSTRVLHEQIRCSEHTFVRQAAVIQADPTYYRTNVLYNYTEQEAKVREATNDEPWGPHSSLMQEISQATFSYESFPEVMGMLWRRLLEDNKRVWRRVYKGNIREIVESSENISRSCTQSDEFNSKKDWIYGSKRKTIFLVMAILHVLLG